MKKKQLIAISMILAGSVLLLSGWGARLSKQLNSLTPPSPLLAVQAGSREELVRNAGFEEDGSPLPKGWIRDLAYTGNKGLVAVDRSRCRTGRSCLKLQPNSQNGGNFPLAVAQVIPAASYRGREVEFSGYVHAEGGATAVLGMLNFVGGKGSSLVTVDRSGGGSQWIRIAQIYKVPDDPSVQLVLTCMVRGKSGTAWFDDVSVTLVPETRSDSSAAGRLPSMLPVVRKASIDIDARTVVRQIPRTLYGTNVEWIWNGNLLWLEDSRQVNPQFSRLTRELGVSLIRYPGGHYSDFYHWRDGVGPYEKRPEALHEKGKNARSRPNFGTDEALFLAEQANAELLITVNAGSGTAQEAADWVKYINGKSQRVRYWEVGNELYMNEGSAMSRSITVGPDEYAKRFREFARAMRTADPRIKIGAIGGENQGRYASITYSNWDRTVLQKAGDQIDFLAVHNAYAPVLISGDDEGLRTVYQSMLAAPLLIKQNLEKIGQQITSYAPDSASRIAIAVTEWGPLFQFDPKSRYVDHGKTLGSALFAASTLKAFIESPRVEVANFFLLNDVSVLGWIGTLDGRYPPQPDWAPTARYYALQLYTQHFGDQLVQSKTVVSTFKTKAVGLIDSVSDVPYLDVVSSIGTDGRQLYIMAINKDFDSSIEASISLQGFNPVSNGTAWVLTGTGIDANTGTTPLKAPGLAWAPQVEDSENPRFYKGNMNEVKISNTSVKGVARQFNYRFPPHSVTSLVITRAK